MDFRPSTLDLHTQELLREVFDDVRRQIADRFDEKTVPPERMHRVIASALMSAVATGHRDRAFLTRYALHAAGRTIRASLRK
jgi:hypothetical protein